ncbi:hypothetical protein OsI_38332 [Oryza sativa Indica Group]|uniref:GTD-binding domain-containing protein n=1 Tax=Oryza sativa subsp. indica TaxID=39946 RepID=A2ZKI1_ORYSI|nr:hypothetical protein OsI_38332 [Oryza sativa Indica Group]
MEGHRVVSIGSEICEQDHAAGDQRPTAGDDGDGDGDGPYVSLFELAPIAARAQQDEDGHGQEDSHAQEVFDDLPAELRRDGDGALTVGGLAAALREQRRELEAVRAELDAERRAGAEAAEYQRQLEEQGEFDREAVRLAMQLVHEAETEKHALQRQLDAFRAHTCTGHLHLTFQAHGAPDVPQPLSHDDEHIPATLEVNKGDGLRHTSHGENEHIPATLEVNKGDGLRHTSHGENEDDVNQVDRLHLSKNDQAYYGPITRSHARKIQQNVYARGHHHYTKNDKGYVEGDKGYVEEEPAHAQPVAGYANKKMVYAAKGSTSKACATQPVNFLHA